MTCLDNSCINKLAKTVNIMFKMKAKGIIQQFTIDSTKIKIYGQNE
ncbi:hypothetical protein BTN50_1897 [Candidatus Enterovibrio altilux]|uniref:Mobile element protein n=1 Tax=Candidatus Enterovibrio altilux TaxID=1927128 RepID=A0A291BBE6_9GAMM|nr:hypothetical protein BTN50_1897 [Candidatus Enterovibrio luxaltus]